MIKSSLLPAPFGTLMNERDSAAFDCSHKGFYLMRVLYTRVCICVGVCVIGIEGQINVMIGILWV